MLSTLTCICCMLICSCVIAVGVSYLFIQPFSGFTVLPITLILYVLYGLIKYVICLRQVIHLFHFHFRQVKEGCGLIIEEEDLTMYGTLDYEFLDKAETMYVHVFLVTHFSGVIKKTDGMAFIFLLITFTK